MGDVSKKLMAQFAHNLNTMLDEDGAEPAPRRPPSAAAAEHQPTAPAAATAQPQNRRTAPPATRAPRRSARSTARPTSRSSCRAWPGTAVLKRLLPVIGGLVLLFLLLRRARPSLTIGPHRPARHSSGDHRRRRHERVRALLGRRATGSVRGRRPRRRRRSRWCCATRRSSTTARPMPTRYWLVGPRRGRWPSAGSNRRWRSVAPKPSSTQRAVADAHRRYAAERDAAIPADHVGPRPSGGVAGTRAGVKCLHAHYAWYLAGGDDIVGAWVAAPTGGDRVVRRPDAGGGG